MSARTDAELALLAQKGDREAESELFGRLKGLADYEASKGWYASGWDHGDVLTEAYSGLLTGIRSWREDGGSSVARFGQVAARSAIITALQGTLRMKRGPLNGALSLDAPIEYAEGHGGAVDLSTLGDMIEHPTAERAFEEWMETGEGSDRIAWVRRFASPLEQRVLDAMVANPSGSYAEWAQALGIRWKTLDNAITRLRHKALVKDDKANEPKKALKLTQAQRAVLDYLSAHPSASYRATSRALGMVNELAVSQALMRIRRKCAEVGMVLDSDFTIRAA